MPIPLDTTLLRCIRLPVHFNVPFVGSDGYILVSIDGRLHSGCKVHATLCTWGGGGVIRTLSLTYWPVSLANRVAILARPGIFYVCREAIN